MEERFPHHHQAVIWTPNRLFYNSTQLCHDLLSNDNQIISIQAAKDEELKKVLGLYLVLGFVIQKTQIQIKLEECSGKKKESGDYKGKTTGLLSVCQELRSTLTQKRKYLLSRNRLTWFILE